MSLAEAWAVCAHGGSISRPTGARIEKWMTEKPGMKPAFERFIEESVGSIPVADLMAGDWSVDA